ncbi:hypothetical protein LOTGIDRAFT_223492 [Lottia gigantea]|uniref:Methionine--tRNA ligase, mitochondrial n=1 Tax=Lottia gigantea TaxID=225164 RepID=V3ZDK9_LOTGI|nr:hypothetical protein LOTGIDRAFT_223492 [Lottia gigantea]ESO82122.1 hypothetical protein LOTGIDRAFT_223492 [Lottia gigantea]
MILQRRFLTNFWTLRTLSLKKSFAACCYSSERNTNFFVTTPIFYVNSSPHIGHLYTVVLADFLSRWNEVKGRKVLFSTGVDEHGLKIQQSAAELNKRPIELCNKNSSKFKDLFKLANISHTDFIRTTEDRHRQAVETFWTRLEKNGYIYKGVYEGWYSISDEAFLSDNDVTDMEIEGKMCKVSVESKRPVTWMTEENYKFKLSSFKDGIRDWLNTGAVNPVQFDGIVRRMLEELQDLSVSRQADRISWGITVPGDSTQVIYVWLDALVNYLTVAGYPNNLTTWPPDCQIIGKDILKFHAIYWPAFLLASELPLPTKLFCHSHWLVNRTKMSKSIGNVVDPIDRIERYTVDGLRYFLLRIGVPGSDGNYNDELAVDCINSELVNTLGNLLNRVTSYSINRSQVCPASSQENIEKYLTKEQLEEFQSLRNLPDIVGECYEDLNVYKGLEKIMSYLHWVNTFIQEHKPWQLAKQSKSLDHLNTVIFVAMVSMRTCGILLQPVVPDLSNKLLDKLNVPKSQRHFQDATDIVFSNKDVPLGKDNSVLIKKLT